MSKAFRLILIALFERPCPVQDFSAIAKASLRHAQAQQVPVAPSVLRCAPLPGEGSGQRAQQKPQEPRVAGAPVDQLHGSCTLDRMCFCFQFRGTNPLIPLASMYCKHCLRSGPETSWCIIGGGGGVFSGMKQTINNSTICRVLGRTHDRVLLPTIQDKRFHFACLLPIAGSNRLVARVSTEPSTRTDSS